jgi:protease-4
MHSLGRFFHGLWRGLDVLRRLLHLLLLLALFGLLVGLLREEATPRLPAKAALVVRPSGEIVEQLSGAPVERAVSEAQGTGTPQTLLWDLTTAIRAAASDARIGALVIDTDDMGEAGQAKLEELAAAIAQFRHSGKKVIALGTYFIQSQYYLAAQADEVYLDPFGFVLLDGYARYRMYYKGALDKLSVDMHLFRVGKFKSAAEPYIRKDMSDADREESLTYLSALWGGYERAVASARKLTPQGVGQYADGYAAAVTAAGGNTAQVAKDGGLVTDLKTREQVEARVVALVGADAGGRGYRQVTVADYLRATRAEERERGHGAAVGVVVASGEILDGRQPPGTVGGESTSQLLREARFDPDIRAVVLRVDSPGGSVLASEQIYREVAALRQSGKPVVASMGDVAASGGYYIAAGADQIIASANSITGSIGVFAAIPTFSKTLAKIGITTDGVGTTPLAGVMQLDRPLSDDVSKLLQSTVDHAYGEFTARVSKGRGMTQDAVDAIAQGRVWAGVDAQRNGLVDRLGTYEDAVLEAARRGGLKPGYGVRRIEPQMSWAQQLLLQVRSLNGSILERAAWGHSGSGALLQRLAPLDRELTRALHMFGSAPGLTTYAYCFCSAP